MITSEQRGRLSVREKDRERVKENEREIKRERKRIRDRQRNRNIWYQFQIMRLFQLRIKYK